jgi:hypothetical protein
MPWVGVKGVEEVEEVADVEGVEELKVEVEVEVTNSPLSNSKAVVQLQAATSGSLELTLLTALWHRRTTAWSN